MRANASAITSDFSRSCRSYDDVRVERAAARPVDICGAAVGARRDHFDGIAKRELFADAIDAHTHALARYRAGNQDNLAFVPREHASAGDGFLDRDDDLGTGSGGACLQQTREQENSCLTKLPVSRSPVCICLVRLGGFDELFEQRSELPRAPEILGVPLHGDAESRLGTLDGFDDAVGGGSRDR